MEQDKKIKPYSKWRSRRWLIAFYWMIIGAILLVGNKFIQLPYQALNTFIGAMAAYMMLFTGYETHRKIKRESQDVGSQG